MNTSIKISLVLVVASILLAACQKDKTPAPVAAPATAPVAKSTEPPPPSRAKPDFGGVTTQHVEVTATGPTIEAAVNNAIRLAVEQVNGKRVAAASIQISSNADVSSPAYADIVASATSGAVSHFQIISQQQKNIPVSTNEESLKASQGESWNKGNVDAASTASASVDQRANYSERADAAASSDRASGRASAGLDASASTNASMNESDKVKGSWDQHQGASQVDYQNKHVDYVAQWEVRIGADVATYRESEGAKLTRVVVAPPQVQGASYQVGDNLIRSDAIADEVQSKISSALTQTHRFTVLDRNADAQINQEIGLIQSGNATPADTARLGQRLAADLIVIPTINRFEYARHEHKLRMAARSLVSYSGGGEVAFRVVNAVTGQIVLSQSFQYDFPPTAPTTLGISVEGKKLASDMMDAMDRSIVASILQSTFPLSIVQVQGNNVVINQGGDSVQEGAAYQVVTLGKPIIDPQSGQSLGPTETPCCSVQIDRVTPNLSYGHILEDGIQIDSPYTSGSMELRRQVAVASKTAPLPATASVPQHAKAQRTANANDDATSKEKDANW